MPPAPASVINPCQDIRHQRGFTLVETLLVLVIAGMGFVAMTAMFSGAKSSLEGLQLAGSVMELRLRDHDAALHQPYDYVFLAPTYNSFTTSFAYPGMMPKALIRSGMPILNTVQFSGGLNAIRYFILLDPDTCIPYARLTGASGMFQSVQIDIGNAMRPGTNPTLQSGDVDRNQVTALCKRGNFGIQQVVVGNMP